MQRDLQIDFVRGAGILMIAVDHLGYLADKFASPDYINPFITWMRLGWSSAAEFFVFFSGYLTGLVYLKTLQVHGPGMLWARAAHSSSPVLTREKRRRRTQSRDLSRSAIPPTDITRSSASCRAADGRKTFLTPKS